jgi:predicted RNase H-like HicB family nuclease
LVFEPKDEAGYHVYASDVPGLYTQGENVDEATENAQEALPLYVEGLCVKKGGRSARALFGTGSSLRVRSVGAALSCGSMNSERCADVREVVRAGHAHPDYAGCRG